MHVYGGLNLSTKLWNELHQQHKFCGRERVKHCSLCVYLSLLFHSRGASLGISKEIQEIVALLTECLLLSCSNLHRQTVQMRIKPLETWRLLVSGLKTKVLHWCHIFCRMQQHYEYTKCSGNLSRLCLIRCGLNITSACLLEIALFH